MDIYYLILVVPALILSFIAQGMVQSTFKKYSSKKIERNITGAQAANYLLQVILKNVLLHNPAEKFLRYPISKHIHF